MITWYWVRIECTSCQFIQDMPTNHCLLLLDFDMLQTMKRPADRLIHKNTLMRGVFFGLGVVFLVLGLIGVIVPGMPTTVFVLLAGYCWARSSRRFYAWLMSHRIFGKMLTDWQERRAMPRFAKYLACLMMTASTVVMFVRLPDDWLWLGYVMAAVAILVAIWMARLPDA